MTNPNPNVSSATTSTAAPPPPPPRATTATAPPPPAAAVAAATAPPPPGPARRSYRACLNCRRHKTKCDLGDVNAPQSPPCGKCKRTRTECVFAEGRRGGRGNIEAGRDKGNLKRKQSSEDGVGLEAEIENQVGGEKRLGNGNLNVNKRRDAGSGSNGLGVGERFPRMTEERSSTNDDGYGDDGGVGFDHDDVNNHDHDNDDGDDDDEDEDEDVEHRRRELDRHRDAKGSYPTTYPQQQQQQQNQRRNRDRHRSSSSRPNHLTHELGSRAYLSSNHQNQVRTQAQLPGYQPQHHSQSQSPFQPPRQNQNHIQNQDHLRNPQSQPQDRYVLSPPLDSGLGAVDHHHHHHQHQHYNQQQQQRATLSTSASGSADGFSSHQYRDSQQHQNTQQQSQPQHQHSGQQHRQPQHQHPFVDRRSSNHNFTHYQQQQQHQQQQQPEQTRPYRQDQHDGYFIPPPLPLIMNPSSSTTSLNNAGTGSNLGLTANTGSGTGAGMGAGSGSVQTGPVAPTTTATATSSATRLGAEMDLEMELETPGTTEYLDTLFRHPQAHAHSHPTTQSKSHLDNLGDRTISPRDLDLDLDLGVGVAAQHNHNAALRLPTRQVGPGPMLSTSTASPRPHDGNNNTNSNMNPVPESNGNMNVGGVVGYGDLFGLGRGDEGGGGSANAGGAGGGGMGMDMAIDLDLNGGDVGVGVGSHSHSQVSGQAHGSHDHGQHGQIGFALPAGLQIDPTQTHREGVDVGTTWDEQALRREHPDLFETYGQVQVQTDQQPQQQPQSAHELAGTRSGTVGSGRPIDDTSSMMPPRKRRFRAGTASDGGLGGNDPSPSKTTVIKANVQEPTVSDPRSFVINTGMHNESDALQILAMAATSTKKKQDRPGKRSRSHSESTSMADSSVVAYRRGGGVAGDGRQADGALMTEGDTKARSSERGSRRRGADGQEDEDDVDDRARGDEEGLSTRGGSAHLLSPSAETWQDGHTARGVGPSWDHGRRANGKVSFNTSAGKGQAKVPAARPTLLSFPLVAKGIMDPEQVCQFGNVFFNKHHYVFPLISHKHIPRTEQDYAIFASAEPYLMTAFIIIASRLDSKPSAKRIHAQTWALMKGYIGDVELTGAAPTIGLVEGILLLAENLPRDTPVGMDDASEGSQMQVPTHRSREKGQLLNGVENRQAWMLIGGAIRMAYGLGIDQLAHSVENASEEHVQRATIAWTYCYIFDRQISIRTGRAFWSRGPALCFRGYSSQDQTGPAGGRENFPSLCDSPYSEQQVNEGKATALRAESAELLQAYVELTQCGEYFKYLDGFNSSLENFKMTWLKKTWLDVAHGHLIWVMFHYCRLYASSFAFQAHVTRTTDRANAAQSNRKNKDVKETQSNYFPRTAAFTPDALYIYESINAARELMRICIEDVFPQGFLPYLPSRYLLWFQYGAVFLLKAVYSGAMVQNDRGLALDLVEQLCQCLCTCSDDSSHPAVRYGRMLRVLASRLAVPSPSACPSRATSPQPQEGSGNSGLSAGHLAVPSQSRSHSVTANNHNNPAIVNDSTMQPYTDANGFNFNYGLNTNNASNRSMTNPWNPTEFNDEDCANLLQWLLDEPAAQTAIPNLLGDPFDLDIQL